MDGYHRSSKSTFGANKLMGTNTGCRDIFPVDSGADDLFNCCQCKMLGEDVLGAWWWHSLLSLHLAPSGQVAGWGVCVRGFLRTPPLPRTSPTTIPSVGKQVMSLLNES